MLAMVALVGGIIVIILLFVFLCQFLFLSQQREKTDADECALSLAHVLNERDRLGQMNTIVERSRELVYASRTAYQGCVADQGDPNLEDLSRLFVEESRSGAQLAESGRRIMTDQVTADVLRAAKEYKHKLSIKSKTNLGWLTVSPPELTEAEFGIVQGVLSNTSATDAFEELLKFDRNAGYLPSNGRIFAGDVNARLPSPDDDLNFKFCPLAFPIGRDSSPPRLTANSIFKPRSVFFDRQQKTPTSPEQLPSAVRVKIEAPVGTSGILTAASRIQTVTSAAAGGAALPPDEPEMNPSP